MKLLRFMAVIPPIILVCVIFLVSAHAQDRALTLKEIIAIGKANNGELKALREEKGLLEAGVIRAGLYANPTLDLEGTTGALTGSPSETRLAIGLSQEFLTGGKRVKRRAVADAEVLNFENRMADAERLFLQEVKTAFYDLQLAEERLHLAQQSYELSDRLFQMSSKRFAAGDVAKLDVNMARVERGRNRGLIADAERELNPARERLLSLVGLPVSERFNIIVSPETHQPVASLTRLQALALQKRPDLQFLVTETGKRASELSLAQAERYPNVTLGLGVSRERSKTSLGGLEESSTDTLVGVKLSLPIPLFDRNLAGIKEAQSRKNSLGMRERHLRLSIQREVAGAYERLVAAEKTLRIYATEVIPQLSENVRLMEIAYRLGEVGISTLIVEQKGFIETKEAYLSVLYNRNTAQAKLEAALGVELDELGGEIK